MDKQQSYMQLNNNAVTQTNRCNNLVTKQRLDQYTTSGTNK